MCPEPGWGSVTITRSFAALAAVRLVFHRLIFPFSSMGVICLTIFIKFGVKLDSLGILDNSSGCFLRNSRSYQKFWQVSLIDTLHSTSSVAGSLHPCIVSRLRLIESAPSFLLDQDMGTTKFISHLVPKSNLSQVAHVAFLRRFLIEAYLGEHFPLPPPLFLSLSPRKSKISSQDPILC